MRDRKATNIIRVGFVAAICFVNTMPVSAGEWKVTYECDGAATHNGEQVEEPEDDSYVWPSTLPKANLTPYEQLQPWAIDASRPYFPRWSRADATNAQSSGMVTAIFTWQPSHLTDVPPPKLTVLEDFLVEAEIRQGHTEGDLFLNHNFEEPVLYTNHLQYMNKKGRRLLIRKVAADGVVRLPMRELAASASASSGWDEHDIGTADFLATVTYQASIDSRNVQITSNIEDSYFKSALGSPASDVRRTTPPATGPYPLKNNRRADGLIDADSVMNWDAAANEWFGYGIFEAQTPGTWTTPMFQWSLAGGTMTNPVYSSSNPQGANNRRTLDLNRGSVLNGQHAATSKISLGGSEDGTGATRLSTLTVTGTDSGDSAVGTNTFKINWHMPYENWQPYAPEEQLWNYPPLAIENPGYAVSGGGIGVQWSYEGAYWGDAVENLISVAGGVVPRPYNLLFTAARTIQIGPQASNGVAMFDSCWGKEGSTYSPSRDDSKKSRYEMEPVLRMGYTTKFFEGDKYDEHGYVGKEKKVVRPHDGRKEFVGEFTLNQPGESAQP